MKISESSASRVCSTLVFRRQVAFILALTYITASLHNNRTEKFGKMWLKRALKIKVCQTAVSQLSGFCGSVPL